MTATGWLRSIDPSGRREAHQLGTGHGRGSLTVGHDSIWVAHRWGRTLVKVDPDAQQVLATHPIGKPLVAVAAGEQAIWALASNGWLWKLWPAEGHAEGIARIGSRARALAAGSEAVWALRRNGELLRVDAVTGGLTAITDVGVAAQHLAWIGGGLWAGCRWGRRLRRVDADSGTVTANVRPGGRIAGMTTRDGHLWVAWRKRRSREKGRVAAYDAATGSLLQEHPIDEEPRCLTAGLGAIWLGCGPQRKREGSIVRLDPLTGEADVVDRTHLPIGNLATSGDLIVASIHVGLNNYTDSGIFVGDGGVGGGGDGGGGGS